MAVSSPQSRIHGPQTASAHRKIANSLEALSSVSTVWLVQSSPQPEQCPPTAAICTSSTVLDRDLREELEDWADKLGEGWAPDIRIGEDIHQLGRYDIVPRERNLRVTIRLWRHPFAPDLQHHLSTSSMVGSYSLSWEPSFDNLRLRGLTNWSEVSPVGIKVSFTSDAPEEAATRLFRELRAETLIDRPEAYIVALGLESGGDHDTIFSLGFAERAAQADSKSRVYHGDAKQFSSTVQSSSRTSGDGDDKQKIQLTITSPPYLDAVDYDAYAEAGDRADWSGGQSGKLEAWKEIQQSIFESVFSATQEGGFCAVVIGTVKDGTNNWIPLPHHFADVMESIGWKFHERIMWNKVTGGSPRFGTTVQYPYPTQYYPNQQHEEIQIWRKGDVVTRRDDASKLEMTEVMKQEIANNCWHIPPVPMNASVDHPCPFPEEIAHRLTILYSCTGDVVADPMAGSGTTLKVADRLGRIAVGTELRPEYVAEARRRLATEPYDRRDQLLPEFEKVEVGETDELSSKGSSSPTRSQTVTHE